MAKSMGGADKVRQNQTTKKAKTNKQKTNEQLKNRKNVTVGFDD